MHRFLLVLTAALAVDSQSCSADSGVSCDIPASDESALLQGRATGSIGEQPQDEGRRSATELYAQADKIKQLVEARQRNITDGKGATGSMQALIDHLVGQMQTVVIPSIIAETVQTQATLNSAVKAIRDVRMAAASNATTITTRAQDAHKLKHKNCRQGPTVCPALDAANLEAKRLEVETAAPQCSTEDGSTVPFTSKCSHKCVNNLMTKLKETTSTWQSQFHPLCNPLDAALKAGNADQTATKNLHSAIAASAYATGASYDKVSKAFNSEITTHNEGEAALTTLARLKEASDYYKREHDEFIVLHDKEVSVVAINTARSAVCAAIQATYEKEVCEWNTLLTSQCYDYYKAFQTLKDAYTAIVPTVKKETLHRLDEYKAAHLIVCYVSLLGQGKLAGDELQKCVTDLSDGTKTDLTKVAMTYPDPVEPLCGFIDPANNKRHYCPSSFAVTPALTVTNAVKCSADDASRTVVTRAGLVNALDVISYSDIGISVTASYSCPAVILEPPTPPTPSLTLVSDVGPVPPALIGKMKKCEGDCDYDSDCVSGLACFQRGNIHSAGDPLAGFEKVPQCSGAGVKNKDYCYDPMYVQSLPLDDSQGNKNHAAGALTQCQGDCDKDAHCAAGLACWQRNGQDPVPGCTGTGKANTDYCYKT